MDKPFRVQLVDCPRCGREHPALFSPITNGEGQFFAMCPMIAQPMFIIGGIQEGAVKHRIESRELVSADAQSFDESRATDDGMPEHVQEENADVGTDHVEPVGDDEAGGT